MFYVFERNKIRSKFGIGIIFLPVICFRILSSSVEVTNLKVVMEGKPVVHSTDEALEEMEEVCQMHYFTSILPELL